MAVDFFAGVSHKTEALKSEEAVTWISCAQKAQFASATQFTRQVNTLFCVRKLPFLRSSYTYRNHANTTLYAHKKAAKGSNCVYMGLL